MSTPLVFHPPPHPCHKTRVCQAYVLSGGVCGWGTACYQIHRSFRMRDHVSGAYYMLDPDRPGDVEVEYAPTPERAQSLDKLIAKRDNQERLAWYGDEVRAQLLACVLLQCHAPLFDGATYRRATCACKWTCSTDCTGEADIDPKRTHERRQPHRLTIGGATLLNGSPACKCIA
jgi:hypothetical protein